MSLRNILLIIALALLVGGAILRIMLFAFAWFVIIAAFVVYIIARFFLKRK